MESIQPDTCFHPYKQNIMKLVLLTLSLAFSLGLSYGQDTKETDSKTLIEKQRFEFVAESANPMRGRSIFLSTGYSFVVLPDSIMSNLPYYGRAFQASLDPDDAGYRFTSTDFDYAVKPRKKNGWDINIKPKDVNHSPQIFLSISNSGTGTLRITSANRESISFSGRIQERRN